MSSEAPARVQETRTRVKWLMTLRVTVITVLLGSLAVLQFYQEREPGQTVYLLIAATYLLTLLYSVLFNAVRNFVLFAYVQIAGDVMLATGLVYATGGVDSAFSFTYVIAIIAAGIILYRRGSFFIASLAGISYGTMADLQFYGFLLSGRESDFTETELFYNIFLSFVAFFSVAFLSSSLSERLRQTSQALEEKNVDYQELQALNESIVRSMADGMFTVDMDGRLSAFNKAAEEITGLSLKDVRGRRLSEVFGSLGGGRFLDEVDASGRSPYRAEVEFMRPDKDLVLGLTVSNLRNEDGEVTGLLGIVQDLTPMKEMEEELKRKDRLAAIGELSAGMAHEIRNPLASLSGSLQVLKSDLELAGENLNLMQIALDETDRLNRIVTEFLTYARPKMPEMEQCDLHNLIRETAEFLGRGKDFRDGIELVTELPDEPLMLRADPDQFRQLLLNLSINAAQAIPDRGRVKVKAAPDGYGRVSLVVEDDGVGIRKQDIEKIFYPFFSTKEGGAGLGLSIVYRIVEDHGGTIRVESEPGAGTRFLVTLPVEARG